ncbi:NUDIX domain-containing protein [Actinoplanes sp. NPDC049596]|uniref:NUDIX domain-containing protein n=1 Tax=unclassified Actinoplanes TaxID=2626549 RepID=UPI003416D279
MTDTDHIRPGAIVPGRITRVTPTGVFVRVADGLEGVIPRPDARHPAGSVDDAVMVEITKIEDHRITLRLTTGRVPRAAAVVVDGSRVLLIKRFLRLQDDCPMCEDAGRTGHPCPGHHYAVLPGGHIEPGETPAEAATRELHEETTLTATPHRQLWTGRHNGRPAYYFLMTAPTGTPRLSGEEAAVANADNSFELLWATPAQFAPLNLHPADVREPLSALLTP